MKRVGHGIDALSIAGVTTATKAMLVEVPVPKMQPGWVLVRVRGLGLNHSELELRQSEIRAPYITKPIIPGIEGVGEVVDPGNTKFTIGTKVCMLMGGMGRMWNGSYAEYCLVPESHLFTIPEPAKALSWTTLAAIPETYYTAWGSLFEGLQLGPNDTLLVRGASCGLGYAAIQIAHTLGSHVIASTHRESYAPLLRGCGADEVILDNGTIAANGMRAHKALELLGPKTLLDSMACLLPGGICCDTGILGGMFTLDRFDPIKSIPNGRYLTGFFSNYPTQEVIDELFTFVAKHNIEPVIAKAFSFESLVDALAMQEEGGFQGKLVVTSEQ